MADKIASYEFIDKEHYEKARDKIIYDLGSSSYESGSSGWVLHILSDCSDPSRAAQICMGYGGKPY